MDPAGAQLIERFLYQEARLLDSGQFSAWLALFSKDSIYWAPRERDQTDPLRGVSLIFEDRALLELRVNRLQHPRAHALKPLPRTLHTVSNVLIGARADTLVTVNSALLMIEYRLGAQQIYAARVEHQLRTVGTSYEIVRKRVELLDCDAAHTVMSIPF